MTPLFARYICLLFALLFCLRADQTLSPVEFLHQFIDNPSRTPMYEEGVKVMDQIVAMPPDGVRATVPVIFTALSSPNLMAQLEGALALNAVSLRPDGASFLNSRLNDIFGLLSKNEARIKMTVFFVTQNLHTPADTMRPVLLSFISDPNQPDQVKPTAISALAKQTTQFQSDMVRSLTQFYTQAKDPSIRLDTLNAIASNPIGDPGQISLVIAGLHDTNADVRAMTVALVNRLGPKAISQADADLRAIVQDQSESPNVRQAAAKTLKIVP